MADEMNSKLEALLSGMGASTPLSTSVAAPTPEAPPTPAPVAPPPPQVVQAAVSPELLALVQRLEGRLSDAEKKLSEAQQQAVSATVRLQEKEAAQKEMEAMFQTLRAQQRSEETHQLERDMAAKMQARIQSLEERLDKQLTDLQASWSASVREIVNSIHNQPKPPAPPPPPDLRPLEAETARLREQLQAGHAQVQAELTQLRTESQARNEQSARLDERLKHADVKAEEIRALQLAEEKRWLEASSHLEDQLARFATEIVAVQTALPRVDQAEKALEDRQRALAEWGKAAGESIDLLRKDISPLHNLPEALEALRLEALGRDQELDARLTEVAAYAEQMARDQQAMVDYVNKTTEALEQTGRAVEALDRRLTDEAAALGGASQRRDEILEKNYNGLKEALAGTQRMLDGWQDSMERRVAAVQAGWSGVLGTVNDTMIKLKKENEATLAPWRSKADELERKVGTLEAAWPILSQAIPEGVLRKVRQDLFKLELRLAELENSKKK